MTSRRLRRIVRDSDCLANDLRIVRRYREASRRRRTVNRRSRDKGSRLVTMGVFRRRISGRTDNNTRRTRIAIIRARLQVHGLINVRNPFGSGAGLRERTQVYTGNLFWRKRRSMYVWRGRAQVGKSSKRTSIESKRHVCAPIQKYLGRFLIPEISLIDSDDGFPEMRFNRAGGLYWRITIINIILIIMINTNISMYTLSHKTLYAIVS